jgi:hypothetical protein
MTVRIDYPDAWYHPYIVNAVRALLLCRYSRTIWRQVVQAGAAYAQVSLSGRLGTSVGRAESDLPARFVQLVNLPLQPTRGSFIQPYNANTDDGKEDRFGQNYESRILHVARICVVEGHQQYSHPGNKRRQIPTPNTADEITLLYKLAALEVDATGKPCVFWKRPPGTLRQQVPDQIRRSGDDQAKAGAHKRVPAPKELIDGENHDRNCRNILANIPPMNPALKLSCDCLDLLD